MVVQCALLLLCVGLILVFLSAAWIDWHLEQTDAEGQASLGRADLLLGGIRTVDALIGLRRRVSLFS